MSTRKSAKQRHLRDEYKTAGPAPFSLYTENHLRPYMAPLLTLPGKPPHRLASGVVRR